MDAPRDVLGVGPDADEAEITAAYRRRVKEAHPDQGGSPREFRRVAAAYEALLAGEAPGLEDGREPAVAEGPGVRGGEGTEEETDPAVEPEVEYLNYAALADHGWDLDDEELFERAAEAGLGPDDYGRFAVEPGETLLEAAERCGFAWPYSCRGGACANCAVSVAAGELDMPADHILTEDLADRGIRLSCIGTPAADELRVVYNVKHLPDVEDLLLPPGPFGEVHRND